VALAESRVTDSPLFEFQSVNDPRRPLAELERAEREQELARIRSRIRAVLAESGTP
jgi:hypothetical protein